MDRPELVKQIKRLSEALGQFKADGDGYLTKYYRDTSFLSSGPAQPEAMLERILEKSDGLQKLLDALAWAME